MRKGPQIRKLPHVTLALALSMDELYTTCKHTQNVQFGTRKQNKPPNTPDKDKKKEEEEEALNSRSRQTQIFVYGATKSF